MPSQASHVTTTFVEDSNRTVSDYTTNFKTGDYTIKDQSITDFLAKPTLLGTTTWTTSNVANTDIVNYNITSSFTSNTAWTNKTEGYQLLRGTPVITVIINANPFQQGKLYVNFFPCDAQFSSSDPGRIAMHRTLLSSKRMLPGVEVDCRDSGAVLKIPYITPTPWYTRKGLYAFGFGSFWLTVLSPLQTGSGGELDVQVSVYLHFEDVELAAPIVPQSDVSKKKFSAKQISKEHKVLSGGKVSKGLSLAASISNSLEAVPMLNQVAQPTTWILRGLSGLASYFGWSKADMEGIPMSVSRQFQHYGACSDGTDPAYPLSLYSDNSVKVVTNNSLVDADEMSFEYLKKISTILQSIDWNASDTSGTSLTATTITPATLYEQGTKTVNTHTATYKVSPPFAYLSNFFKLCRGSLRLTIKLAKTEFHSGRLMVTWTPSSGNIVAPTLSTSTLALREIIDIRCGTEFTLDLPYLLEVNYTGTAASFGYLNITVLNELRCPETCSQKIPLLLYWSAGDDFELQVPNNGNISFAPFSPQMDCKQLVNEPIGGSVIEKRNLEYAHESIGESFASVKQLLNRNTTILYSTTTMTNSSIVVFPYAAGAMSLNSVSGALQGPTIGGDIFSMILGMYAFYKGGVRLVVTPGTDGLVTGSLICYGSNNTSIINSSMTPYVKGPTTWVGVPTATTTITMFSGVVQTDEGVGMHSFRIPYQSKCKCSMALYQNPATNYVGGSYEVSQPVSGVILSSTAGNFTNSGFSRSFSDDFVFSYFLGCPPLLTNWV